MRFIAGRWMDDADFRPYGDPETRIEIGDDDLTLGLRIVNPFGPGTDAMLAVHAREDAEIPGGEITLAITSTLAIAHVRKPLNLQSNPRRPAADTGEEE